jgi:hypothetical protein
MKRKGALIVADAIDANSYGLMGSDAARRLRTRVAARGQSPGSFSFRAWRDRFSQCLQGVGAFHFNRGFSSTLLV